MDKEKTMPFELPELPYPRDALAPQISKETLDYHYGKHHQSYLKKLNDQVSGSKFEGKSLEDIVRTSSGKLFNNAAQVWNHSFYWNCLSPQGGGAANGPIAPAIEETFGAFDEFRDKFTRSATGNFGSGWTWLIKNGDGTLAIVNTSNANTPLTDPAVTPVLTVDVWEHAYYIDYRNGRPKYLEAFWALVNWEFVNSNYS
jgi:Fe-Mn family superoxide dismutase